MESLMARPGYNSVLEIGWHVGAREVSDVSAQTWTPTEIPSAAEVVSGTDEP